MRVSGIDMTSFIPSVAAQLAHMDDEAQSVFFNTFAKELVSTCGSKHQAEMQAAFVKDKASEAFKDFCAMVAYNHP